MRIQFRSRVVLSLLASFVFASCLASLAPPTARADEEMSFQAVRIGYAGVCRGACPTIISATGQITENTPGRFVEFLQENGDLRNLHAVVFLDSPGGRVIASMELGTLLRKVGAAAVVARVLPDGDGGTVMTNAQCYSACVYALMGARKRVIPSSSQIGIHRMFAYEEGVDASGTMAVVHRRYDNGDLRGYLMRYSSDMGVSPGLIAAAEHIPSDNLKILSRAEIRRWHLGVPKL